MFVVHTKKLVCALSIFDNSIDKIFWFSYFQSVSRPHTPQIKIRKFRIGAKSQIVSEFHEIYEIIISKFLFVSYMFFVLKDYIYVWKSTKMEKKLYSGANIVCVSDFVLSLTILTSFYFLDFSHVEVIFTNFIVSLVPKIDPG